MSGQTPIESAYLLSWDHLFGPKIISCWKPTCNGASLRRFNLNCNVNQVALDNETANSSEKNSGNFKKPSFAECLPIEQALLCQSNNSKTQRYLLTTISQLLHGELGSGCSNVVSTKVLISSDDKFSIHAARFNISHFKYCSTLLGEIPTENIPLYITIVLQLEQLDHLWQKWRLINSLLQWLPYKQTSIQKSECDIIAYTEEALLDLCRVLPSNENLLDTSTSGFVFSNLCELQFNRPLLQRALTSHLQTCGNTVVIGEYGMAINKFLSWLLLFLESEDFVTIRFINSSIPLSYNPGFLLQGLLKDKEGKSDIWVEDMMLSAYPTTIVDLDFGIIRQSKNQIDVLTRKKAADKKDLKKPENVVLNSVKNVGSIVPQFLEELFLIPPVNSIREDFVKLFGRHLRLKGVILNQVASRFKESGYQASQKALMNYLDIKDGEDLKVFASSAEKLVKGKQFYFN